MKQWANDALKEIAAMEKIIRALGEYEAEDARVLLEAAWNIQALKRRWVALRLERERQQGKKPPVKQ